MAPNPVLALGLEFMLKILTKKVLFSPIASNYMAEFSGMLNVLKYVSSVKKDLNFTVVTDSRSALQALESFNPRHPIVLEIVEWLHLIEKRGKKVIFCWVPAHVGVAGNESADALAREAALHCIPRRQALPFEDFVPALKSEIRNVWQFRWDLVNANKMREITKTTKPWVYASLPRLHETILCRLRIGHTRLMHGFLMSGDPQPYCDDYLVPLTVSHFLVECPSPQNVEVDIYLSASMRMAPTLLSRFLEMGATFQHF